MQEARAIQAKPGFIDQSVYWFLVHIWQLRYSKFTFSRTKYFVLPNWSPEFEKRRGYEDSQVLRPKEKIGLHPKSLAQNIYHDPKDLQEPPIDSPRLPTISGKEPTAFCETSPCRSGQVPLLEIKAIFKYFLWLRQIRIKFSFSKIICNPPLMSTIVK